MTVEGCIGDSKDTGDRSQGNILFLQFFQATEDLLVCLYFWINADTILLIGGGISLALIITLTLYKFSRDGF